MCMPLLLDRISCLIACVLLLTYRCAVSRHPNLARRGESTHSAQRHARTHDDSTATHDLNCCSHDTVADTKPERQCSVLSKLPVACTLVCRPAGRAAAIHALVSHLTWYSLQRMFL